jgi:hypothetical protein
MHKFNGLINRQLLRNVNLEESFWYSFTSMSKLKNGSQCGRTQESLFTYVAAYFCNSFAGTGHGHMIRAAINEIFGSKNNRAIYPFNSRSVEIIEKSVRQFGNE